VCDMRLSVYMLSFPVAGRGHVYTIFEHIHIHTHTHTYLVSAEVMPFGVGEDRVGSKVRHHALLCVCVCVCMCVCVLIFFNIFFFHV
jgi:hypothetical protein